MFIGTECRVVTNGFYCGKQKRLGKNEMQHKSLSIAHSNTISRTKKPQGSLHGESDKLTKGKWQDMISACKEQNAYQFQR
ncbi:hypothetical protein NPIL_149261 [Nephila pilipes]|uniref:Uncharacterized protein n=1 Tax=Nephila pilipes TaxID=299642 RepID=A0A8X6TH23_NEPPI|nr:hypothetical protein NPIL_149261 [Nephila pilipes]